MATRILPAGLKAYDYEAVTVSNASIGLTASKVVPTSGKAPLECLITVEDETIRFRLDGTAPTTTEGHKAIDGDSISLTGQNMMTDFRAIRDDAADATLRVTYLA